jgi:hypothetical protein
MVVTYHKYSALGSDDVWELQAAAAWWQTNYASMSEAGTFDVILMNEWYAFIQLYIDVWQIRFSLTAQSYILLLSPVLLYIFFQGFA